MASERAGVFYKRTSAFVVFFLLAIAAGSPCAVGQDVPRLDLFGGYSYQRLDTTVLGFANYANQNGWNVDATANLNGTWGLTGDLSGHYGSHIDAYNYLAGPQYSWRSDKWRLFGHVLFGKADDHLKIVTATRNEFTSVGLAIAGGGGFDWNVTRRFTFRVVQADYLHTHTFGVTENNIRVSTGLVVHFGSTGKRRKP
jgi:hypothetical protein